MADGKSLANSEQVGPSLAAFWVVANVGIWSILQAFMSLELVAMTFGYS